MARLTSAILALNTKVDSGTEVSVSATPTAGDEFILKRGSTFYRALVDTLLGGGGGSASLPTDVVTPAAGQEAAVVVGGVWKRTPIADLINQAYPDALGLWDHWAEWRAASGNANAPGSFVGASISSGTNNTALPTGGMAGYNDHGVFLRSSTTANGGYRYQTTSLAGMYFGGGVGRKFRAQCLWRTSFTGVLVRPGYHDSNTNADAVDGAYFEINGSTCSAKTANNSVRTTHATTITLALDTAYTFDIEVNPSGTEARFRVWGGNDYSTALMDVTITDNIPTTAARAFGAGIVATESSTTAVDMIVLYSLSMGTIKGFERAHGIYSAPAVRPSAFTAPDWDVAPAAGAIAINVINLPAAGSSAITAIRYRVDGGAAVTLSGGTGLGVRNVTFASGETKNLQLQLVTAVGEGQWSDTKTATAGAEPTAPAAFTDVMWTLTAIAGGLRYGITSLPSNGGSAATAIEATRDGGTTWTALGGTTTGNYDVTGLPAVSTDTQIRLVNAVGSGPASDVKTETPLAAGSGPLAFVQAPTPVEQPYSTVAEQTLAPVATGNSLVVVVMAPTSAGVPTISDSAANSWGSPSRSYDDPDGSSMYFWRKDNVIGNPTWVRATLLSSQGFHISAFELSGAGAGLVEDDWDFGEQTATDTWNMPFTSSVANVAFIGLLKPINGNTPTGTAPVVVDTGSGGYQIYAHGIFPTAGANTATVTLSTGLAGTRSWWVLRAS